MSCVLYTTHCEPCQEASVPKGWNVWAGYCGGGKVELSRPSIQRLLSRRSLVHHSRRLPTLIDY